MNNIQTFDRAGVAISALCIMHCLLLPFAASALPLLGLVSENEAIHKVLVLLAIIPAIIAFTAAMPSKYAHWIRGMAVLGVVTLFIGAFVESLHDFETVLTLIGACILALAHILRSVTAKPHMHEN